MIRRFLSDCIGAACVALIFGACLLASTIFATTHETQWEQPYEY